MLKRLFDLIFSLSLLVVSSPLLLIIGVVNIITSGLPVFFFQDRVGLNGRSFKIIKFRTMVNGAEKSGTGLDSFSGDPRVTKFGQFLRASSLDELPQLINILKGDMSFVGPRPPVTYSPFKYDEYPEYAKKRFDVKPGVTGLAQINGRNELTWEEKWKFDLEYLEKRSFFFDLKIILKTAVKVIKNEGAHDLEKNK
ncbi:sugar transferase [Pseudoalteromonas phenolica]|uniref:Sugar transferase n=1 Tax=Pseudoalteromonas phenolica TaxID=161398 RepID=A0A4Q7ISK9_9GAMM|nr:sugar transferase [Pseudoalteromonas phenolica]RZQ54962.1 sugar transferase [Pseudoalteromonas phenolica]